MPLIFQCPCGQRLTVPRLEPGRLAKCPRCGQALRIQPPPESNGSIGRRIVAGTLLSMLVLTALGVGLQLAMKRRPVAEQFDAKATVPTAVAVATEVPPDTRPTPTQAAPPRQANDLTQPITEATPETPEPDMADPGSDLFPLPLPNPPAFAPEQVQEEPHPFVERLNAMREAARLRRLRNDSTLSAACTAHADYLKQNQSVGRALNWADEQPSHPGFSVAGRAAARSSVIRFLPPGRSAAEEVDQLLAGPRGRLLVLNPDLHRLGVGAAELGNERGTALVLDLLRGRESTQILYCPSPGQVEVPTEFAGNEIPDPIPESKDKRAGYPITVTFPRDLRLKDLTLTLRDAAGHETPAWVSTPEKPVLPEHQGTTACLIAKAPLEPAMRYTVEMTGEINGHPERKTWAFTTWDIDAIGERAARRFLERLNNIRESAGLPPAKLDERMSAGALAHARYLGRNGAHPSVRRNPRNEDRSLPGYTPEGEAAGREAFVGVDPLDPVLAALDDPLSLFSPRLRMLHGGQLQVGYGCARDPGKGWYSVLVLKPVEEPRVPPPVVLHPSPDAADVPLAYLRNGSETPSPLPRDHDGSAGYPITARFPGNARVAAAALTLTDAQGQAIEGWLSTPANPYAPNYQNNVVCLIPKKLLASGTRHRASLRATVDGQPVRRDWEFTTGTDGVVPQAVLERRMLRRLNGYRALAGVPPAERVDPYLSHRCRLHAEYLLRNVDDPVQAGLSMHDEDPKLPGYSAEGHAAGQASVITIAGPRESVDSWMGTFYHRIPLLHPDLLRIGVGVAYSPKGDWICVMDVKSGVGHGTPICFPGDGQKDVPTTVGVASELRELLELEGRAAAGYPITVAFPPHADVRNAVVAVAMAETNEPVTIWSVGPDRAKPPQFERPVAIALPRSPLAAGTQYRVNASARINGVNWSQAWSFTTR